VQIVVEDREADRLLMRLPARPASARAARKAVQPLVDDSGVDPGTVALCVSEVVTNAVVHAYRDQSDGVIVVRAWKEKRETSQMLHVVVSDDGIGMQPRTDSPGLGLGLAIVTHLTTRLVIALSEPGSVVEMSFAAGPACIPARQHA